MADKIEIVELNKGADSSNETVTRTWVEQDDGTYAPKSASPATQEVTGLKLEKVDEGYEDTTGSSQTQTIPDGANAFQISAEGGSVYYSSNEAGDASTSSGGYCPQDGVRFEGPFTELTSLKLYLATGAKAHINYYAG